MVELEKTAIAPQFPAVHVTAVDVAYSDNQLPYIRRMVNGVLASRLGVTDLNPPGTSQRNLAEEVAAKWQKFQQIAMGERKDPYLYGNTFYLNIPEVGLRVSVKQNEGGGIMKITDSKGIGSNLLSQMSGYIPEDEGPVAIQVSGISATIIGEPLDRFFIRENIQGTIDSALQQYGKLEAVSALPVLAAGLRESNPQEALVFFDNLAVAIVALQQAPLKQEENTYESFFVISLAELVERRVLNAIATLPQHESLQDNNLNIEELLKRLNRDSKYAHLLGNIYSEIILKSMQDLASCTDNPLVDQTWEEFYAHMVSYGKQLGLPDVIAIHAHTPGQQSEGHFNGKYTVSERGEFSLSGGTFVGSPLLSVDVQLSDNPDEIYAWRKAIFGFASNHDPMLN